ncbi:MAG: shikimate dehydrogenase [Chthoniobacterales bacterium]
MKDTYTLNNLRDWRGRTREIDSPVRLGVLGDPIEHSLSPQMQSAALEAHQIDARYARFHIAEQELIEALQLIRDLDFLGLNLTVPHKIAAISVVDSMDEMARAIGAINTIQIADGKLAGFNTDADGFVRAVRETFSVDVRDLRVLLLGAGGAARAIAYACGLEKCERLVIVARDVAKAQSLAQELIPRFRDARVLGPVARLESAPWDENSLRHQLANSDMVVNATPLGLAPRDGSPIPSRLIAPHLIVYDTVYRHDTTPLVRAAEEAGARAADGRAMLLHQGARAFEIWFGRNAPLEMMRAAL